MEQRKKWQVLPALAHSSEDSIVRAAREGGLSQGACSGEAQLTYAGEEGTSGTSDAVGFFSSARKAVRDSHQNVCVSLARALAEQVDREEQPGQVVSECTSAVTGVEHPRIPSIYNRSLQQAMSRVNLQGPRTEAAFFHQRSFPFGDVKRERSFGAVRFIPPYQTAIPFTSIERRRTVIAVLVDVCPFSTVFQQHPSSTFI